jgi:hypothetical protein
MISISKILTLGLLLWAGLLTLAPGALCAQKVAWTIKNGVVSGENFTSEVWGRPAENSVPVLDKFDARHSLCPNGISPHSRRLTGTVWPTGRNILPEWKSAYQCGWATRTDMPKLVTIDFCDKTDSILLYLSSSDRDICSALHILDSKTPHWRSKHDNTPGDMKIPGIPGFVG